MSLKINAKDDMIYETGIDNRRLKKDTKKTKGILGALNKYVTKADIFAGMASSAALASSLVAKYSFTLAKNFEHSMKEVQTISQAVSEDFEGISDQLKKLATEIPEQLEALPEALYQVVSAGYDGAQGLEVLTIAAKAAIAGVTDTKTAVDGLTTVLNAFHFEASEVTNVADAMFIAVKRGKTTFGELSAALAIIAPIASSTGIAFDDLMSAMATITKQGVPTSMAATQIRAAIISLNEHMADGWTKTMSFQEAIIKFREKAGGSIKVLRELTGRVEGMNAILALTGGSAAIAAGDIEAMGKKLGAFSTAYEVMVADTTNQSKILMNNIKVYFIMPLGDILLELAGKASSAFNKIFEEGRKLIKESHSEDFKILTSLDPKDRVKAILWAIDMSEKLRKKTELTKEETGKLNTAYNTLIFLVDKIQGSNVKIKFVESIKQAYQEVGKLNEELKKLEEKPKTAKVEIEEKIKPAEFDLDKALFLHEYRKTKAKELFDYQKHLSKLEESDSKDLYEREYEFKKKFLDLLSKKKEKTTEEEKEKAKQIIEDQRKVFSDAMEGLSSIATIIGGWNRDLVDTMDLLADMATFSSAIQKGSLGPLGMIAGATSILSGVFKLFKSSAKETKSLIEQMKDLQEIQQNLTSFASGERRIASLKEEYRIAQLILGAIIGGDLEKQKERSKALADIKSIEREIFSSLTTTTSDSIAEGILEGFLKGEDSVKNFTENFNDMMSQALLGVFKRTIVTKNLEDWYRNFAKKTEGGLTGGEIDDLRNTFQGLKESINTEWKKIQDIANQAGLDLSGSQEKNTGLAGAIAGITEDTANILSGQFTASRIDVKHIMGITESILIINTKIADNTELSNVYLKSIESNSRLSLVFDKEIYRSLGSVY